MLLRREPGAVAKTIGIDIGGTNIKVGLLSGTQLLCSRSISADVVKGPHDTLSRVVRLVRDLCLDLPSVAALGVGIPGLVEEGRLLSALNFPGWHDVPIKQFLEDELKRPVEVMVDLEAVAAGELWAGGHGSRSKLFVFTLGTGVGAAAILNRNIYAGAGGFMLFNTAKTSGDLSSLEMLEDLIAAPALVRRASKAMELAPDSLLWDFRPPGPLTAELVCEAARRGDSVAKAIYRQAGSYLGWAAVNVAHLFLLDRVVVGGGVAYAGEILLGPAREVFSRYLSPALSGKCDLTISGLGAEAGIIGAAMVAANAVDDQEAISRDVGPRA